MTCKMCEEKLLEYLYDELDEAGRALMDGHLAESPACRETLRGFRSVRAEAAGQDLEELPAGFTTRILAHAAEHQEQKRRSLRRGWFFRPVLTTAVVAVIATIVYVHSSHVHKPTELSRTRMSQEAREEADRQEKLALRSATPEEQGEESAARENEMPGSPAAPRLDRAHREQVAPEPAGERILPETGPLGNDQTLKQVAPEPAWERELPETAPLGIDQVLRQVAPEPAREGELPERSPLGKNQVLKQAAPEPARERELRKTGPLEKGGTLYRAAPEVGVERKLPAKGSFNTGGTLEQAAPAPAGEEELRETSSPDTGRVINRADLAATREAGVSAPAAAGGKAEREFYRDEGKATEPSAGDYPKGGEVGQGRGASNAGEPEAPADEAPESPGEAAIAAAGPESPVLETREKSKTEITARGTVTAERDAADLQATSPAGEESRKARAAVAGPATVAPTAPPLPASAPPSQIRPAAPAPPPEAVAKAQELARAGRCQEALDLLEAFAPRHPEESSCGPAWLELARCFLGKGDGERARQMALKAAGFPACAREAETLLKDLDSRTP